MYIYLRQHKQKSSFFSLSSNLDDVKITSESLFFSIVDVNCGFVVVPYFTTFRY